MHPGITFLRLRAHCNRRIFLAGLGYAGTSLLVQSPASSLSAPFMPGGTLLCAGSAGADDSGTLHLLEQTNGRCEEVGSSPSARPFSMARHPQKPILYVANAVRTHAYEPRGTVEAFLIDAKRPRLELLARQPLSLSATEPMSLDLSPDGRHLMVASFEGGAYNLLPIDPHGVPGEPEAILKQVGRSRVSSQQSRAHPAAVLFHPHISRVVAADFGADRLELLSLEQQEAQGARVHVADRRSCQPGSGPSGMALHRGGTMLVVRHRLRPILSIYRITPGGLAAVGVRNLGSPATAVIFHPQRDLLYSTECPDRRHSRMKAWRVCPDSGTLQPVAELTLRCGRVTDILTSGEMLWIACESGVLNISLDSVTGFPTECRMAAMVPGSRCLAALDRS